MGWAEIVVSAVVSSAALMGWLATLSHRTNRLRQRAEEKFRSEDAERTHQAMLKHDEYSLMKLREETKQLEVAARKDNNEKMLFAAYQTEQSKLAQEALQRMHDQGAKINGSTEEQIWEAIRRQLDAERPPHLRARVERAGDGYWHEEATA